MEKTRGKESVCDIDLVILVALPGNSNPPAKRWRERQREREGGSADEERMRPEWSGAAQRRRKVLRPLFVSIVSQ